MARKKQPDIKLTELFMAKAGSDWSRCFHGTIQRKVDSDGNPFVFSEIKVNDGYVMARAKDQWVLGEKLDELVLMNLDYGLHADMGKISNSTRPPYFLN